METVNLILVTFTIVQLVGAKIDSHFAVDPEEFQLREISENLRRVSGVVMGLTEYVMEIKSDIKTIRNEILEARGETETSRNGTMRPNTYYTGRPVRDPEEFRRQSLELADKVERLLAMDQSPEVDLAKEELRRTVEKNFLRMLAAILVTGPAHTQERSDDIFKLMRSVLNGELDFTPVVQRLPLILRDSETNQFVSLLITLRESERVGGSSLRQELYTSVESSAHSRQIAPNFPIPNSPQLIGTIPNPNLNINNINANRPPPYLNIYQNPNYQSALLQQANQIRNPNNRVPPPRPIISNSNNINSNPNNINSNPNNINNNGEQLGENLGTQTPNPNGNQLPSINSLLDAMTQTNQLIKEIPTLVEGLQTLIESLEGLVG